MISLEPVTLDLAQAVLSYSAVDVPHAGDWPHEDSYDALRPFAEHGGGPGTFLVVEDGVVVGDCGWFGPPDEDGEVEIGYGLAPSARGRGLGTEAVRLLVEWVRGQGARSVRAEVLPGNETSLRLLARLGFEDIGERAGHRILVS
ncbi:MAG: [ribosomal protein S5]-alanine N-acetyltransferase [Frankiales bacterium]|nr:[ribosomal protein S5]-alanine N-acetyltransferase [Frankiales bacterium]